MGTLLLTFASSEFSIHLTSPLQPTLMFVILVYTTIPHMKVFKYPKLLKHAGLTA